ncbi:hypothetical protein T459_30834 [Capsicum annuum]|uniref:Uncharacterized protein n=1 Tax=Capsicum annuum TaxID=4072 RepID=A0A2G2Y9P9_CAPAN|nr:hypothetical protein T459_30834 [Capsicum annuum]
MSLSISRRLLRSFTSFNSLAPTLFPSSNGKANVLGDGVPYVESSVFRKTPSSTLPNPCLVDSLFHSSPLEGQTSLGESQPEGMGLVIRFDESILLARRRYSTSILTPDSSDGSFPSDLLTKRHVSTPEREIVNTNLRNGGAGGI